MGQTNSSNSPEHIIPETVSVIQDEVIRQARIFTEIATLSYEEFQLCLKQLNELSRKVTDHNGKQLLFAVKKGTDSTVLWKGTVKIACVKIDPETKVIECHRLFNLNQFMKIFKTLECQLTAALQSSQKEMMESLNLNEINRENSYSTSRQSDSDSVSSGNSSYHESGSDNNAQKTIWLPRKSNLLDKSNLKSPKEEFYFERKILKINLVELQKVNITISDSSSSCSEIESEKKEEKERAGSSQAYVRPKDTKLKSGNLKKFTASMLLEEVDNLANSIANSIDKLGECCICLERKPDVMLPCAHAYCMPCIEQWNAWHKTCPFCRETLDNTDDTWVISDIPGSQEISDEICSALMDLTSPE